MATDFPTKGDDKKISLRNSQYPQFDFEFAKNLKENHPKIWRAGGNIRGNDAYLNWEKARKGQETEAVLDWIKEREAWSARHFRDGKQFKSGGKEPNLSNVAGVVAQIKMGHNRHIGRERYEGRDIRTHQKTRRKKGARSS